MKDILEVDDLKKVFHRDVFAVNGLSIKMYQG